MSSLILVHARRRKYALRHRSSQLIPNLEVLEHRQLLSTFPVTSTADDGSSGTLRWAIAQDNSASSPSAIEFELGTTAATITLSQGVLDLTNTRYSVTIYDGPGQGPVTISGNGASQVFQVSQNVTASISGVTITGGSASGSGSGGPSQGNGGAIYNQGNLTLTDCTISGSSAQDDGGGLANNGTATLNGCTISGNSAQEGGGLASYNGSGYGAPPSITLTDCTISGNTAGVGGGGGVDNYGEATFTDCNISNNTTVSPDVADGNGGGVENGGTLTLTSCTINGNTAVTQGGGLANRGAATLTDCAISGNVASVGDAVGGGISDLGKTLTLAYCTISANSAASEGGGVFANGDTSAILTACTISGNKGYTGGGLGGAAYMTDCTIYGNSALYYGGGVMNDTGTGKAGNLTACTVSGNSAGKGGGGVYESRFGSYPTLTDTIVAGNTGHLGAPSDIGGNASGVTGTYNLIGTGGSGGIVGGSNGNIVLNNLSNLDLGPLANNGGPTETMALLPGSAAIQAGIEADYPGTTRPITTDQRGDLLDSPPDIGAYQLERLTIYTVNSTGNSTTGTGTSGALPYVIALANANTNPDGSEIEFDPSVFSASSPQTIVLGATLVLSETDGPEVIDGPGAAVVSISGGNAVGVFQVANGVTASLTGLTITGGSISGSGGGIYNQGDLTLTGCTISGNSAQEGGGIDNIGTATLNGCAISGNSASSGSGIADDGSLTLESNVSVSGGVFASGSGSIKVTGQSNTFSGALMVASGALDVFSGLNGTGGASLVVNGPVSVSGDMTIGGTLSIAGDLTMTSAATLNEQMGGALGSGQVGQIDVGDSAALDGTFNLDLVNGFTPSIGQDFPVLTYASAAGTFAAINGLPQGMIADQGPAAFYLDVPATPTISWTNPNGGDWDVAANWSTGVVPSSSDVVSIDTAGTATITIQSGDDIQVQTLTTGDDDTLSITGGSLTVTAGISTLSGPLSMTGGTLTATGSGVNLTANGATSISSASLLAEEGAALDLPQLTTYTSDSNTFLQADGADSLLDLSALTSQTQEFISYCQDEATNGGMLNLNSLTSLDANGRIAFTDTGGSTLLDGQLTGINAVEEGSIAVSIDGTDPQFDQSWTSFSNADLFVSGGENALPHVTNIDGSELLLSDSASLALPALTTLDSAYSDFQVSGSGGELDLSALTSVTTTGPFYISVADGATLNLSSLASLSSTQALDIYDTGGSTLEDGNLTDLSGANITLDGTDSHVASAWRSFSGNITLTRGTVSLPNVATATFSGLEVDAGATLDMPASTAAVTDTGDVTIGGTLDIAGNLTLTSTATLDEQIGGAPGSGLNGQIEVGGSVALGGTLNVDVGNGFTPSVGQEFSVLTYASATGSFSSVNGLPQGMIADQGVTSFDLDVPEAATISWTNPNGGDWDVAANWSTGVVPTSSDAVTIDTSGAATITIQSGDDIQVQSITTSSTDTLSIANGSLMVTVGPSTLNGPLSINGGSLTASGSGVNLTASGTTAIATASLYALGGATLTLPELTSYVSENSTFQADGENSELSVSALTSVTQQGPWDVEATNGGTLDLGGLSNLTSTQGIAITDTGGSTLLDGELTSLSGVDVTLDGTDTQVAAAWKSFAGSITLTGGSEALTNVSSASFSGIQIAAGSTLNLPASTGNVTNTGVLTIDPSGELNIAGNLTLTSASTLNEQISGTPASGQFGQIAVGGTVMLAGTFNLDLLDGFTSTVGQDFPVMTFASATGTFSTVTGLTEPGSSFTEELNATSLDLIGAPPPPAFTADTPPTAVANSAYSYQFQAAAAGAPTVTYSATGLPAWAQLDASTGLLTGTPTTVGTYEFSVTASDGVLPNTTVNVDLLVAGGTGVTINVAAGTTFTVPDGTYADGTTFNVGAGAMVTIPAGTFTGGVVFNVSSGAVVDLTGGGAPSYAGTLTGSGTGTVELASGRLYIGTGGLTFDFDNSMFQWSSSTIDAGNGDLTNLGTMNLTGSLPENFYNDGTFDNFGTIIQTGVGSLNLGTDGLFATTLVNEAGASYLLEGDGSLTEVSDSGSATGQVSLVNTGLIDKTAGTGTSYLSVLGSMTNTGTIEADSGTIALDATLGISQLSGDTLTAGTWNVENGASLQFPSGTNIATNAASLTMSGAGATITGISGLTSNSGSFSLLDGADFATASSLLNSGSLTVGAGSTLSVASNITQTSSSALNVQIGGTPASGEFGLVSVTGTANLAGTFTLNTVNGFTASPGQDFKVMTFAGSSGSFSEVLGFGSTFSDAINPASFDIYAFLAAADLQLSDVTGPATATPGQQTTVSWQVTDLGPADATGNWQDSVYLSFAPSITSTSILLGTEPHTGGLAANATYTGNWTGAAPGVLTGDYYFVVQVDSLYQVPDPDRSNNALASGSPTAISIPTLTIGTPASANFAATGSDVYYQLSAAAGSSFVLALTGSPASENNAIYVSFNSVPTTYQADFQSSLTGPNPTVAVPATLGGNYYILVHNQSGPPGAFSLTASLAGLTLLQSSPSTVGSAGQATLSVSGLNLGPDTTFTLNGPGGPIAGTTLPASGSTVAYVTFNLSGVTAGTYDLDAMNADGTTAALSGAVTVTAGGGSNVVATTVRDSTVRAGHAGVMYVQYTNTGDDDAGAPLITLISTPDAPIGLDPNETPADVELQVLGINQNGPAGILPPGATFQFPVYFIASNQPFDIELDVAGTSDNQPLEWDAIVPEISAQVTDAGNWQAVYAQLQQMFGSTWGQYISVLDNYATILPASVADPSNPVDVLQLAANQAVAAVSTSISGVAIGTASGVILAGNTITATNATTGDVFTTNILNDDSFVFSTITAGSYTFAVNGDLLDGSPAPITVNSGQAVTGVTVVLDPEVTLSGQVTAGGVPVANADISVLSTAGVIVTSFQSDANGNYVTNFPAGSYTIIVDAEGFARNYASVTLANGLQALNLSLVPESAISGSVSLSDGNSIQDEQICIIGLLEGNDSDPYFSNAITGANFLLGSLPPGTYDFSIVSPNYTPFLISNVQIAAGQTVNLGTILLTPEDSEVYGMDLSYLYYAYIGVTGMFANWQTTGKSGPQASDIVQEYFTGVGAPTQYTDMSTGSILYTNQIATWNPRSINVNDLYEYSISSRENPSYPINNSTDVGYFQTDPTTAKALQATLAMIINSGLKNLPEVQAWVNAYEMSGTIPHPLSIDVQDAMTRLGLAGWQDVTKGTEAAESPATNYWEFSDNGEAEFLAGGVGVGGALPTLDNRVITGTLTLYINCSGQVTVVPSFYVTIQDTFDFDPPPPFYKVNIGVLLPVLELYDLERLGLTSDVPFSVMKFPGPIIDPGSFTIQPPNRQPCKPRIGSCIPAQTIACNPFNPGMSRDPNALFGPVGFGPLGFIQPGGTWLYTVDFENDGNLAAQDVSVTEQLDPNLDWSTFQLGSFGFGTVNISIPAGLTEYQTTVSYENTDGSSLDVQVDLDFDVATGLLTATFTSLDPTTGETPTGVFDGFLYPESDSPIGSDGYVQYTVQPDSGLTTGATINQQASVVFDTNASLNTGVVTNTIDAGPPTSSVAALPATETTPSFTVSWSGSDDPGGSGIASYAIYDSDNGSPYQLFMTATVAGSATFTGQIGNTYSFYSVATDNVGNVQPTPTAAQATTTVIVAVDTTTTLQSSENPSKLGDSVTFTATVSPADNTNGTPTGSVQFSIDGATVGDLVPLDDNGEATFTMSSLAVGSHTVTADYINADGYFNPSSGTLAGSQVVTTADTLAVVGTSAPTTVYGQSVTFTATVSAITAGLPTPTGSVEFFDGTTELDSETLDNTGTAAFTTSALAAGTHSITVQYLGDPNFSGSTSFALTQTVNQAASATGLSLSSSTVDYGQSVTFTATVGAVAPGSGTPTGSVAFFDGTTELGAVDLSGGSASFSTATLAVGTHSITAQYLGDDNFTGSTSPAQILKVESTVGLGTTTSVVSSANPSVFGQSVTLTASVKATVKGSGQPTGTVTFLDGTSTLGTATLSAGKGSFEISTLAVGTHAITAVYSGDTTFAGSTSPNLSQTVNQDATRTTVTASSKQSVFGQSVTFTATVTAKSPGSGTPTGQVTFMDGSTQLGNATLSGGTATLTTSSLSVGNHAITVVYGGNTDFLTSTSTALSHRVNQDGTTTVVSSSANPSVYGQLVTFTATVSAASPGSGTPTGIVTFYDGSKALGKATLSSGMASFETSALSVGTHSITAVYGGDTDFKGSRSAILKQVVQSNSDAIRLVTSVPPTYDEIAALALPDDGMDELLIHDLALEQVSAQSRKSWSHG